LYLLLAVGGLLFAACAGAERHERAMWYVSTTGDDANSCTAPDLACRTIVEAYNRADADDQINIAAGTYNEVGRHDDVPAFPNLDIDLRIVGAGAESTVIDLGNLYAGFYLVEGGRLRLENLTIQNARGNSPGGCVIVFGGILEAENVHLTRCLYAGINIDTDSQADLVNVTITDAITRDPYGVGNGVINRGTLAVQGGEISRNTRVGIFSSGQLEMNGTLIEGNALEGLDISGEANLTSITVQANGGNLGHFDGMIIKGDAEVSLTDSLVTANIARGVHIYGEAPFTTPADGVPDSGPRVLIQNTLISDHELDGLYVVAGTVTLDQVTIRGNGAGGGKAIENSEALIEISNSLITQNLNGGIRNYADGEINLFESTVSDNRGNYPPVYNEGSMNIQNSLVAGNSLIGRGVIDNYGGDLLMANTTVSQNEATAITLFQGNTTLSFVTIADNAGGGIIASNSGEIHILLNNVLVARNVMGDCNFRNPDAPTPILTGINIATHSYCNFPITVTEEEILVDNLADNGGPTLTQALLPGSPALDAATGACIEVDQRLSPRPIGPACDVGAYEAGAVVTSIEVTPTPATGTLIVTEDFPCYSGPGPQYNTLSTLLGGTQMNIVGYSFAGGWFIAAHPTLQGNNCWIDEDFVETMVPIGELRLIAVPPKPTATPSPMPEPRIEEDPTACPTLINKPGYCK
jgi:hypothetical protein